MTGNGGEHRGREHTTVAILDAAEDLFSAHGFTAVTVRAIAECAGVSHALVHRYVGSKADIYRAVLTRNEEAILEAAPDDPDLLASASLMFREALATQRQYVRLIAHSALHGLSYDRTSGRFAATERLVELAERAAAAATPEERADKDLDPRLVVAACVALLLGWSATESWVRPAAGIEDMDEAEVEAGLERILRGILGGNVPGRTGDDPAAR
jgi:AcrR family transcriptional regulator